MSGPLSERIQYAFNMQDVSARGSLNEDEYLKFLDSIVNAAFVSNKGDTSAYFSEEAENFVETLKSAPKKIDKVKYNEIQSKILDHRFINYCNDTDEKRQRASTIQKIRDSADQDKIVERNAENLSTVIEGSTLDATTTEQSEISKGGADFLEESKLEEPKPESQTFDEKTDEQPQEEAAPEQIEKPKKTKVEVNNEEDESEAIRRTTVTDFAPEGEDQFEKEEVVEKPKEIIYEDHCEPLPSVEDFARVNGSSIMPS